MLIRTYILAGGDSRRFGSDKGLFQVAGVPLVQQVARLVAPLTDRDPLVVGGSEEYEAMSLPVVPDVLPGLGPVGGILTALAHLRQQSSSGCAVVVGCDMPWLDEELLRFQLELLLDSEDTLACVPHVNDRWTATHAVYALKAQNKVSEYIESGGRKLQHLMDCLEPVDPVEAGPFNKDRWRVSTRSANRPEDLEGL